MEQNNFMDLWGSTPAADAGNKDFELIEQGKYVAVIEEAKYDMTSQPNKVSVTLKITGSCDGEHCSVAGRKLWMNYNLSAQGLPWFKKDLAMLEINADAIKSVDALVEQLTSTVGYTVEVFVKHNPSKTNPSKIYANAYLNGLIEKKSNAELNF